MSAAAVISTAPTLASSVDGAVVLARNQAGGACLWCGSRELTVEIDEGGDFTTLSIQCTTCGSELLSDRPALRDRRR